MKTSEMRSLAENLRGQIDGILKNEPDHIDLLNARVMSGEAATWEAAAEIIDAIKAGEKP